MATTSRYDLRSKPLATESSETSTLAAKKRAPRIPRKKKTFLPSTLEAPAHEELTSPIREDPDQPCQLAELPGELRNLIYSYVVQSPECFDLCLVHEGPSMVIPVDGSEWRHRRSVRTRPVSYKSERSGNHNTAKSLLLANRLINREFSGYLIAQAEHVNFEIKVDWQQKEEKTPIAPIMHKLNRSIYRVGFEFDDVPYAAAHSLRRRFEGVKKQEASWLDFQNELWRGGLEQRPGAVALLMLPAVFLTQQALGHASPSVNTAPYAPYAPDFFGFWRWVNDTSGYRSWLAFGPSIPDRILQVYVKG